MSVRFRFVKPHLINGGDAPWCRSTWTAEASRPRSLFGLGLDGTATRLVRALSFCLLVSLVLPGLTACSKQRAISSLQVGDCFNAPNEILLEGHQSTQVEVVDCSRAHNSEVVGIHNADQSASPASAVQNGSHRVAQQCQQDFKNYVGQDYQNTSWDIYPLSALPKEGEVGSEQATLVCVALTLPPISHSLHAK